MSDFEMGRKCGSTETQQRMKPEMTAMQERIKHLMNLADALDEYIRVLGDELDDVMTIAYVHGWRSTRVAEGKRMRRRIAVLRRKACHMVCAKSKERVR